jgi:ADP-dependent NAD(P)H-hydrate dehydratase / NAD(P)H-hydrate epimerase
MAAMKILTAKQIRDADQYTIKHEPVKSIDLMERAAAKCSEWLYQKFRPDRKTFKVFCGPGNNGGDGLAIARQLIETYSKVDVYIIRGAEKYSNNFLVNEERLKKQHKYALHSIRSIKDFPKIISKDCIVDAIFGTGLSKPITGLAADVITKINEANVMVVSVDIPSGLFADIHSSPQNAIVHADYTLSFECPKSAFLFPENHPYVGEFIILPIGLDHNFITKLTSEKTFLSLEFVKKLLIKRKKFDHKGNHGHAFLVAGSYGKMGAAVLASRGCMRAGAGLLTTHVPECGYEIMQSAFPEAMIETDTDDKYFTDEIKSDNFDAIGVGPGLSTKEKTGKALKYLLQKSIKPVVIDADALNMLSENKSWLKYIPPQSILTPHPKEFERLTGKAANDFERNELQLNFTMKHRVFVILKGANTCIACPNGSSYFNSTGNPGMATAGSGDVLTGILTGLLAQGYSPLNASILGVYLHGLAGDLAAKHKSAHSLIASDIIAALPDAYNELEKD